MSVVFAFSVTFSASPQTLDGTYTGTIACGVRRGQANPLRSQFTMRVSGGEATYERPIVRPGSDGRAEPTGSSERGDGAVSPSGEVILRGQCQGGFSCNGQYEGRFGADAVRLIGTQRWQLRGKTDKRTCEVDLVRTPPKP